MSEFHRRLFKQRAQAEVFAELEQQDARIKNQAIERIALDNKEALGKLQGLLRSLDIEDYLREAARDISPKDIATELPRLNCDLARVWEVGWRSQGGHKNPIKAMAGYVFETDKVASIFLDNHYERYKKYDYLYIFLFQPTDLDIAAGQHPPVSLYVGGEPQETVNRKTTLAKILGVEDRRELYKEELHRLGKHLGKPLPKLSEIFDIQDEEQRNLYLFYLTIKYTNPSILEDELFESEIFTDENLVKLMNPILTKSTVEHIPFMDGLFGIKRKKTSIGGRYKMGEIRKASEIIPPGEVLDREYFHHKIDVAVTQFVAFQFPGLLAAE